MKEDLCQFASSLNPGTAPRLIKAVTDTAALMSGTVDTIDTLVQKLSSGQLDQQIGAQNLEPWSRNGVRHRCVKSATIAISAAFSSKEKRARELGFESYRKFLYEVFEGAETNWLAVQKANYPHVLTFNYDQAFEIAFLDRFKNADQYLLYGQMALNSGLNLNGIGFEPGAFSFLKLHGSVGMWITDFPGDPIYQQRLPANRDALTIEDRQFFAELSGGGAKRSESEPLLYFPNQRQFILSNESGFLFHNYGRAVWNRAVELISNATEIRVIGYSFSGIDRAPILRLLESAQNCQRLVIQAPDADDICQDIKFDSPRLEPLVVSRPRAF
jgi:hypothetical protein